MKKENQLKRTFSAVVAVKFQELKFIKKVA